MRILVIGAGAVGGYFGGRLLEAGRDVTFLVRPGRAAQLARTGLEIRSGSGDVDLPPPPTIQASALRDPFDVVILSCKSYDLDSAIDAFTPAVGPETAVVPLLNGIRHLDVLDERLGPGPVLGGQCFISARIDEAGRILHLSDVHGLTLGGRFPGQKPRVGAALAALGGARFDARASDQILLEMWEKWVFLATLAGTTCLMRASIGDVVAAGGSELAASLLDECRSIATEAGYPPRPESLERARGLVTAPGSPLTASMLGDVERGARTEADHVLGDLLRRGAGPARVSLLQIAYTALKAHEARIARESPPRVIVPPADAETPRKVEGGSGARGRRNPRGE
jgi:2-dehydropantoate 2-reductase